MSSAKGFAVVSKDIRNLARDFGENAARIKDTVLAIQGQIAAVRRELERVIAGCGGRKPEDRCGVLASFDVVQKDVAQIAAVNDQIGVSAQAILASMRMSPQSAQGGRFGRRGSCRRFGAGRGGGQAAGEGRRGSRGGDRGNRLARGTPFSVAMAGRRQQPRKHGRSCSGRRPACCGRGRCRLREFC